MALALALAAAVVLACTSPAAAFSIESTWTDARATFYGRDAWALHTGSCGFGEAPAPNCICRHLDVHLTGLQLTSLASIAQKHRQFRTAD